MLVRTICAGLCGSDLYKIRTRAVPPGTVLGHEIVGVVERSPQRFSNTFPPGVRVTLSNHVPCGVCRQCRRGRISSCRLFRTTSVVPGGFAEQVMVPGSHLPDGVISLPAGLEDREALLAEPLGCCLRAMERWRPEPGQRIMVIGLGPMGLLMVLTLGWVGVEVIGVDPLGERRRVAEQKGCAVTCTPSQAAEGMRVQGVVLTACNTQALELAIGAVEPGGWLGLFAGPSHGEPLEIQIQQLYREEVDLIPSYSTGPEHMRRALSLLESGALRVDGLVSQELPIEEVQRAVELAESRAGLKTILRF